MWKRPLPPRMERSPSSLMNDKQCHLVAICALFLLKGASKPSFLRTGNNSHLPDVVKRLRREHVTELLPINVAEAEAGLLLIGCRFLSAVKSLQITQNSFLGGEGRRRTILPTHIILSRYKTTRGLLVNKP